MRADHERDRRADGDQHVGDARERELDRPLLHPEERRQLCVVHLRPEADEACAYKPRVLEVQPAGERMRGGEADGEPDRRHPHREPERGADDERPVRLVLGIEVEAEERARDPQAQHDYEHAREGDDRLDLPEADSAEVHGVDRDQEDGDQAGDHAAEAVDRRLRPEPLELAREAHYNER